MNELRKAAEMALEAFEMYLQHSTKEMIFNQIATARAEALRQALAQPDEVLAEREACAKVLEGISNAPDMKAYANAIRARSEKPPVKSYCGGKPNYCTPEQEPVTLLPDGSAFGVMSFPLPESHWLYAEREYRDGEHEPIELGKPILTHELRGVVVSAMRYAIRGATNCGKEMDFDPDALVQNAVYALCGPYTPHVDAVNISAERVDETAKREHEPVAWVLYYNHENGAPRREIFYGKAYMEETKSYNETHRGLKCQVVPLYTAPPKREWVGLTDEQRHEFARNYGGDVISKLALVKATEAKLKDKNCG